MWRGTAEPCSEWPQPVLSWMELPREGTALCCPLEWPHPGLDILELHDGLQNLPYFFRRKLMAPLKDGGSREKVIQRASMKFPSPTNMC